VAFKVNEPPRWRCLAAAFRGIMGLSFMGPSRPGTDPNTPTLDEQYDRRVPSGWKFALDLKLKDPGLGWKAIAKAIGYSYQTVLMWTTRPEFQRYESWVVSRQFSPLIPEEERKRQSVIDRVRGKFETHMEEMQDRLLVLLDTVDDPSLQAKIAQDWLDRGGAPAARLDNGKRGFALVMSPEMINAFFERSKEAGLIIDLPALPAREIQGPLSQESDQ